MAVSIRTERPSRLAPAPDGQQRPVDAWWRAAVPSRRPDIVDIAVALVLGLYGLAMFTGDDRTVNAIDLILLAGTCTAMVWRRMAPDVILGINLGLRVLLYDIDQDASYPTWAMSIALFTFVAARPAWAGVAAWATVSTLYVFTPYRAGVFDALSLVEIVSPAGFFAAALGGGFVVKRHHQLNLELQAASADVAASVAAREQLAVMEERNRLRDDLHDIVGHHVNVAIVLADAARAAHGRDEPRLLASLEGVGTACRAALDEMDRATAWLSAGPDLQPTPSLHDRHDLLDSVRAAGFDVYERGVTMSQLDEIDQVVSATAHRFLREALTNVLKHSPERWCAVDITVDGAQTVTVTVDSALPDPARHDTASTGTGLRRLRRRVELLGGTLHAGAASDRFVQRATFPLPARP